MEFVFTYIKKNKIERVQVNLNLDDSINLAMQSLPKKL